jgi:hypothetical protein
MYGGTYSTAKHGLIYIHMHVLKCGGPPADGGHPGGRRTGGRAGHPGGQRTGGALHYRWAYMLALWGKGGHGGSPNVEAGKMFQHAALFCISAQPKPSIFGWLFITHLLLVINGELGQFALYHQHFMWLPCFYFPAVPHFNNRYLRVTCSTSRTSTATSTVPSTERELAKWGLPGTCTRAPK